MDEQKHKTNSTPEEALIAAAGPEAASVDKIRDIIFGGQMRDYDRKFARLEDRLNKEITDLKEDVRKKLGAFDSFVKQELESLGNRLKSENEQRKAAFKDVTQELKDQKQTLAQSSSHLEEQLATRQSELRQQLLDQYRNLSEEIAQKAGEAATALQREADQLRLEKADRLVLSSLFTEVALRLKGEFKIPGGEHLGDDRERR